MSCLHCEEPHDGIQSSADKAIDARPTGLAARSAIAVVRGYKRFISPLLPPACRFYPTCSEYAVVALRRYGFFKGSFMALRRIGRCHPFNPGGYDPVR